eukprot:Tbor_TRINITY_DN4987_c3_g1::TRINITY_DN4987_c3_g1_i1::g.9806::m.9806
MSAIKTLAFIEFLYHHLGYSSTPDNWTSVRSTVKALSPGFHIENLITHGGAKELHSALGKMFNSKSWSFIQQTETGADNHSAIVSSGCGKRRIETPVSTAYPEVTDDSNREKN